MSGRSLTLQRTVATAFLILFAGTALAPLAAAGSNETSPVRLDAMDVSVRIDHHYAVTTVTQTLTNPSSDAYEFFATIAAPEFSFVTRLALETGGAVYESRVEDAAAARAAYSAGTDNGAAAIVESRDTNNYQVSLNIPAHTTVIVHLGYEEMVLRVHGAYSYRFPLLASTGGRSVGALTLSATLTGSAPILTAETSHGQVDYPSSTGFTIFASSHYDIPAYDFGFTWTEGQPAGAGSLITHATADGGSFVHVFSAEGAGLGSSPVPKDIVFVIDVSGSMDESLPQVKQVFASIIGDLRPADRFDVVAFSDSIWQWSISIQDASPANLNSAQTWVNALNVQSGTDIDLGLALGASLLPVEPKRAPILVFLSDGEATVGETRSDVIRSNLFNHNLAHASVYTLAFGPHSDYALMQALALENNGEVRRIWLGQDAPEQIRGFYDTISTPLLRGVSVQYTGDVKDTPAANFATAFDGSDLLSVGQLAPGAKSVTVTITAQGADGPVTFTQTFDVASTEAGAFVARARAYERIRALEGPALLGDSAARAEIVSLALSNKFVTPYTSLVVVLPASLDPRGSDVHQPLLMTTSSALRSSPSTPSTAYAPNSSSRAAPGPDALLAGAALASCALILSRRRLPN